MTNFLGKFTNGHGIGDGNGNGLANRLEQIFRIAGVVGIVGLLLCVIGVFFDVQQVLRSYLIAYIFWFGIPFACLSLLLLNHLAGGTWGLITRRPMEAGAATLLLMAPLFLPIAFGVGQIYPWAEPGHWDSHGADHSSEHVGHDHPTATEGEVTTHESSVHVDDDHPHVENSSTFHHKQTWFNKPFYFARTAGYFAVWGLFAFLLIRLSNAQDQGPDPARPTITMGKLAAPGLIVVFLTGTFAMFDWNMSLDPEWYSTIYGAMLIIGMGLQTFAFLNIVTTLLADRNALEGLTQPKRLRDLGNLMLAFVMLWAYTTYSQFLIIWSGDLSEEIPWYLSRAENGWQYLVGFLAAFHFFFPFFVLLFRSNKESTTRLRAIASFLFVIHILDLFWLLGPSLGYDRPIPHLLDFAALIGIGGLWLAAFTFFLKSRPLIASNDPALVELRRHDAMHDSHTGS